MKIGGISSSLAGWLYYLKQDTDFEVDLVVFNDEFDSKYESIKHDFNVIYLKQFRSLRLSRYELKNYPTSWVFQFFGLLLLRKLHLQKFYLRRKFKKFHFDKTYDLAISFANDIVKRQDFVLSNDFVEFSVHATKKASWIHSTIDNIGMTRKYALSRYKNIDFIVNVSEAGKESLLELVPEYAKKTVVVSNPINVKLLQEKAEMEISVEKNKGEFTFVTVSRISPEKRLDRIPEIAQKLKLKGFNFHWLVIGGGKDLSHFQALCKQMNVENEVQFLGASSNPFPYVKNADYFVLTSDVEAQPLVVLEALLLGIPVIATDIPAVKDIVIEGENGYIVPKDSIKIAEKIEEIIVQKRCLKGFSFHYDRFKTEFQQLLKN